MSAEHSRFTGKMTSKDYLKYALLALIEEKNIYKITVRELCDKAMINRSTFYANYEDLDDFYQKVTTEIALGLVDAAINKEASQKILRNKDYAYKCYTKWFSHVHDHYDEFRLFLGNNGPPEFYNMLLKQGIDWYTRILTPVIPKLNDMPPIEILTNYIVGAHMNLLVYYIESEMKYSAEYMARRMVDITMAGPFSIFGLLPK